MGLDAIEGFYSMFSARETLLITEAAEKNGLYISGGSVGDFQPMNINFGIITPLGYRVKGKRNKNAEISARSLEIIDEIIKTREVFRV